MQSNGVCRACKARNLLRRASFASTYMRAVARADVRLPGAVTANDSTSPVPFMEASAINQRNLLPRLAVGGAIFFTTTAKATTIAIFPSCRLRRISSSGNRRPQRPYQGDRVNERHFSRSFHPCCFLMHACMHNRVQKGGKDLGEDEIGEFSPRVRIRRLLRGAIARKTSRISHVLISFQAPDISRAAKEQREGERASDGTAVASVRCRARRYPLVFCIILILCATSREETRNKRLRDDVASFLDDGPRFRK